MELRREHEALTKERAELTDLLASDRKQWNKVGRDLRRVRDILARSPSAAAAPPSPPR